MVFSLKYLIAYILDIIFGDPYFLPHPVRFIGKLISFLETILYRMKNKFIGGVFLFILTVIPVFIISFLLISLTEVIEIILLYTTLATTSLAYEGKKVAKIVVLNDIDLARKELSYLVSRDTNDMGFEKIIMSVVETISENTVDGVISPMFFACLGSFFQINGVSLALPFAMTYKAVNTLDSMVGYKNERYINFGTCSAKIDDFLNFIPARITGMILVPLSALLLGYDFKNSLKIFFRDRNNHSSPNAGQSESAYAGALGLQFGGKINYFGVMHEKLKIGDKLKEFSISDIKKSIKILYLVSFLGLIIFVGGRYLWTYMAVTYMN